VGLPWLAEETYRTNENEAVVRGWLLAPTRKSDGLWEDLPESCDGPFIYESTEPGLLYTFRLTTTWTTDTTG
jgi:hypothetical protein